MWERLRSIWTVPDLRNKILFTLGILLLTRVKRILLRRSGKIGRAHV